MRVSKMSVSDTSGSKTKKVIWHLMMLVFMLGSAWLLPFFRDAGEGVSPVYYIFAVVLAVGATAYAGLFEKKVTDGILFWLVPLIYVISLGLVLLFDRPLVMPFWCFGGILLLCAFRIRYAAILNYYFLYLIGSTQTQVMKEALVMQVVCLLLLCFVMPYVKKWMDAVNVSISVIAVLVSVRLIFYFVAKQEILNENIFYIALVYVAVIFAATLFARLLQEAAVQIEQKESFEFLEELAAGTEEQDAELFNEYFMAEEAEKETLSEVMALELPTESGEPNEEEQTELLPLCEEDSSALAKLSEDYPTAFLHARRVALIASEIAERMDGVNSLLVKAGGFYHEIGRLRGKNTLENTLAYAKQKGFPTALCTVLREHTVNGDKPTSKEAALVFLTDNICSMCEYLKKSQSGKLLIEKVIDKALNLRIAKGDLNTSGLSIKEFSVIRNAMVDIIKEDMF